MELIDVVQQIVQKCVGSLSMTDLIFGTVTAVDPLQVTEKNVQDPIPAAALVLTDAVVRKTISGLPTGASCTVNGMQYPASGGTATLNPALKVGDKLVLLRVLHGQRYLVLSKVY